MEMAEAKIKIVDEYFIVEKTKFLLILFYAAQGVFFFAAFDGSCSLIECTCDTARK